MRSGYPREGRIRGRPTRSEPDVHVGLVSTATGLSQFNGHGMEGLVAVCRDPTHPGDEVERFCAAASLVWWPNDQVLAERPGVCLPRGLVGIDRRPVEALIGPGRMWVLGGAAGCLAVEVVAVDHRFWRLYRLVS